jgi:hypothetical protein
LKGSAAIKAISGALMKRGVLSGAQVSKLCREAYNGQECPFGAWLHRWPPTLEQIRIGYIPQQDISMKSS